MTSACNLRCSHCYNAAYFDPKVRREKKRLTLEESKDLVDRLEAGGFRHLHFLGGEPLLYRHLFELIEYAKHRGFLVSINSNATLLDNHKQGRLLELEVDQFAASLDGCTPEVNDSIRGAGTFERVCRNVSAFAQLVKARQSKLQLQLVFTLTRRNLDDLPKLPALADQLGVQLVVLNPLFECGQAELNAPLLRYSADEVCSAIDQSLSDWRKYPSISLQIDDRPRFCAYLELKHGQIVNVNPKFSGCSAGENVWYLDAYGFLHPCAVHLSQTGKSAYSSGLATFEPVNVRCLLSPEITMDSVGSIDLIEDSVYWKSFLLLKHNFDVRNLPLCGECSYVDVCTPCPFEHLDGVAVPQCIWTVQQEKGLVNEFVDKVVSKSNGVSVIVRGNATAREQIEAADIVLDNGVAVEMWDLVDGKNSVRDIARVLVSRYDGVDESTVCNDAVMFFLSLKNSGVVGLN